jgi:hypothetical protein
MRGDVRMAQPSFADEHRRGARRRQGEWSRGETAVRHHRRGRPRPSHRETTAVIALLCGVASPDAARGQRVGDANSQKEAVMRRTLFWLGLTLLIALPFAYGVQIFLTQDLPRVEPWKWAILFGAVMVVYFARNTDEVLRHRLV